MKPSNRSDGIFVWISWLVAWGAIVAFGAAVFTQQAGGRDVKPAVTRSLGG